MRDILWLIVIVIPWLMGVWSTFFSIVFIPYAWYLIVELYYG